MPEVSIIILCVTILAFGIGLTLDGIRDSASRAATTRDLSELHAALTLYIAQKNDGLPPATLGILLEQMPSAQSRDGLVKKPYIQKRGWTSDASTWVDGWGNLYQYNSTDRTLSSTGNGGNSILVQF